MATPIPKSDVPVEKVAINATYGLSPNRTSIVPYFTNPFKEFAAVHGFVLKWREWERMAGPAINIWSPCTDRSALERRKFLLECDRIYCELLENHLEEAEILYTDELKKFMKRMRTFPSVIRTNYAYELVVHKNQENVEIVWKALKCIRRRMPGTSDTSHIIGIHSSYARSARRSFCSQDGCS